MRSVEGKEAKMKKSEDVDPGAFVALTPIGERVLRELDREAKRRLELARKTTKHLGRACRN